jgi:tellurite resistance protein TerC
MQSIGTPGLWAGFTVFVLVMLALDLGVFHRKAHEVSVREALVWTGVWIGLSLLFGVGVYVWFGSTSALEFLTGYVIEKALSVDNIFVFIVVFSAFGVPAKLQHRVLFWGILGALLMRALFIVLGAALLQRFHWVIYVFGAFLVFTGIKLMVERGDEVHPEQNPLFRLFRRFVPSVSDYREGHFTVVEGGKRCARWTSTPTSFRTPESWPRCAALIRSGPSIFPPRPIPPMLPPSASGRSRESVGSTWPASLPWKR